MTLKQRSWLVPATLFLMLICALAFTPSAFAAPLPGANVVHPHTHAAACAAVQDGDPWSSCCAQSQVSKHSQRFSELGGSIVLTLFFSSGCNSVWAGFANNTGVTLFNVGVGISKSGVATSAGYSSVTDPHSVSSPQLVKNSSTFAVAVSSTSFSNEPSFTFSF
jgi:hypothetical protein